MWLIQPPMRSVEEAALTNSCGFQDLVFHVAVEDADLPWAVTNSISGAVRRGVLLRGRTALAAEAEDGQSEVSTDTSPGKDLHQPPAKLEWLLGESWDLEERITHS